MTAWIQFSFITKIQPTHNFSYFPRYSTSQWHQSHSLLILIIFVLIFRTSSLQKSSSLGNLKKESSDGVGSEFFMSVTLRETIRGSSSFPVLQIKLVRRTCGFSNGKLLETTVKDKYQEVWYERLKVVCKTKKRGFNTALSKMNETEIL